MKLQSRTLSSRGTARRRTGKPVAWITKVYTLSYILVMAALIFGIATYRIHLSQQINDLQNDTNKAVKMCKELDLDIQSLKLQRDELTSAAYIQRQITAYNLQLRAPAPTQVRYITVKYRNGGTSTPNVAVGRRSDSSSQLSLARP